MLQVHLKRVKKTAVLPKKMTTHSAGYDLYSGNDDDVIVPSGSVKLITTGIAISLPIGYEAQIRPRSGLALKNSIGVLNSPGTIDADYRGEIKVILFNFGDKDFIVKPHSRLAQMVISKHETVNFVETDSLDETDRGEGGFGHTDI